jgi:hypothetical protein
VAALENVAEANVTRREVQRDGIGVRLVAV